MSPELICLMERLIKLQICYAFLILLIHYPEALLAVTDKQHEKKTTRAEFHQIDSLLNLSERLAASRPDSAIYFATEAYNMEQEFFSEASAKTLKILADAYYYQNNLPEAIAYYQQSADKEQLQNGSVTDYYAARINDVGYCYYLMGYYEMAVTKYNEALQILRQTRNEKELYATLNNIGTVYFKWGEYDKSIMYFEQTLQYDLEGGDAYNLCVTYNNIGKVYDAHKKAGKAIDYFTLALDQAILAGNPRMEATILSNLGMAFFDLEQYDKALTLVENAMEIDVEAENHFKVAIRENEIAKIVAAIGDNEKAVQYCNKALAFFRSANIRESQAIVLLDLGKFYKNLKEFNKSEECYLEGLEIALNINSTYHAMLISAGLSELYEEWGKTSQALDYYKLYTEHNTKIFNEEKNRQLADFEIKYHTKETEIENQKLKSQNKASQNRLTMLTMASLGLLLLVFLLIYGIYFKSKSSRQQKALAALELQTKEQERLHLEDKVFAEKQINKLQKKQHQDELTYKNNLLANSTLELIRKNEFLTNLKTIISGSAGENGSSKQEIISMINRNIDIDQNWKKFRYEFEESHPGFFDRLQHQYPELSETFTQLSAFLYIGLSTKEIAQLQNVSISAVNKNRQRLRKKFDLKAEADLTDFLKSIG